MRGTGANLAQTSGRSGPAADSAAEAGCGGGAEPDLVARFQPLAADYWGPEARHPYLMAAAALAGAPVAMATVIALLAWAVAFGETLGESLHGQTPAAYAIETFKMMLAAGVGPAFWPAAAAFLALWSLRLRGPESFAAAALLSGPVGGVFYGVQSGFDVSVHHVPMVIAVTILHLVMLQLMRILGGIGRRPLSEE